jgi:hypothetical protein
MSKSKWKPGRKNPKTHKPQEWQWDDPGRSLGMSILSGPAGEVRLTSVIMHVSLRSAKKAEELSALLRKTVEDFLTKPGRLNQKTRPEAPPAT